MFSAMMVRLGVLFTQGNVKALSWSDNVSKVVGRVNDCIGQKMDGQAIMDLCRSRDGRMKN